MTPIRSDSFPSQLLDRRFPSASLPLGTSMRGVYLTGADLTDAIFDGTFLAFGRLEKANLTNVNLNGANIDRASLGGAVMNPTQIKIYRDMQQMEQQMGGGWR